MMSFTIISQSMAFLVSPLLFLILSVNIVQGRILTLNSPTGDLISDGIDRGENQLHADTCEHQYGFLPCAANTGGYLFQILVYHGLVIFGEKLMGHGSEVLFAIIGVGKIGGVIFRILMSLPPMIMMIVSGVFSSKETAQSTVSAGIGIYAGITVFSLTLQWAIYVIYGRKDFQQKGRNHDSWEPNSNCFPGKSAIIFFKDTGVTVDEKTQYTARIMLLSLIPYLIVQLDAIFSTSSRIITLIALAVSSISLLSYFIYQIRQPWIQRRCFSYSRITYPCDDKDMIDESKFIEEIMEWIRLAAMDDSDSPDSPNSGEKYSESEIEELKNWIFNSESPDKANSRETNVEKKEIPEKDQIISEILKSIEKQFLKCEPLVKLTPDIDQIKNLFSLLDTDKDKKISKSELKQLLNSINFIEIKAQCKDVMDLLIDEFDKDKDDVIDEGEFIEGVKKWVQNSNGVNYPERIKRQRVYNNWDFALSIFWIVLAIAIMTFLGGPLTMNILQLSDAMKLPSFCVSFVMMPFATNARVALKAILPASSYKTDKAASLAASLTFSEIYGGVVMNNVAGMTTLLAIVIAKDLTFDFTAEVLTVLVVCGVMGIMACWRKTYPIWTCILAFLLYPFSLALFYFVQLFLGWN